jgi:hypothetical protein
MHTGRYATAKCSTIGLHISVPEAADSARVIGRAG